MIQRRWGRTLVALALACAAGAALAAPADEVKALVERGQAAAAYQLGLKHPEALGDPTFDFYFGIAAIDAGSAGEGVLALERYVLNFPDNLSARLQLARGYFALGEDARAREEFQELRRLNPPADIAATIDRFLDAIRLRETRYTTSTGLYIEAGIGYDSNVNGGVADPNITLPGLGPVIVGAAGVKNPDWYTHWGIGGYITHPIAPGVALFGNGLAELKRNNNDTAFSQDTLAVSGGVSVLEERHLFRVGVNYSEVAVENDKYRDGRGVSGEWQYQIDEKQNMSLGAQTARYHYTGANEPRDADFLGVSAGYRRLFTHPWQPILTLQASTGKEDPLAPNRQDLGRKIHGARAALSFTPAAKWGASLGFTYQESEYGAPDVFLGVIRRDKYEAWDAALTYLLSRNWSIRGEALWTKNRSNVALYAFTRDLYTVKLRYEFK